MNLPALPLYPAPAPHEVHLARQRLYVLSHESTLGEARPTSRRVEALSLENLCRPSRRVSLLPRAVKALDLLPLRVPCKPRTTAAVAVVPRTTGAAVQASVQAPPTRRVSNVSSISLTRAPTVASFAASIGSHATTIRNNMPVYDGDSEVLAQARHAPDRFGRFTNGVTAAVGTPWALGGAIGAVGIWLALGPLGRWGTTWQLIINTGTTIVSFWMVFVLANAGNREAATNSVNSREMMRLLHEVLMWQRMLLPENHPARLLPMPGPDNPADA